MTPGEQITRALGLVEAAERMALRDAAEDSTGQLMFTARQLLDVQTLLEEALGQETAPPPSTGDLEAGGVQELLAQAGAVLDAIAPEDRPARLLPARAELATALLAFEAHTA